MIGGRSCLGRIGPRKEGFGLFTPPEFQPNSMVPSGSTLKKKPRWAESGRPQWLDGRRRRGWRQQARGARRRVQSEFGDAWRGSVLGRAGATVHRPKPYTREVGRFTAHTKGLSTAGSVNRGSREFESALGDAAARSRENGGGPGFGSRTRERGAVERCVAQPRSSTGVARRVGGGACAGRWVNQNATVRTVALEKLPQLDSNQQPGG